MNKKTILKALLVGTFLGLFLGGAIGYAFSFDRVQDQAAWNAIQAQHIEEMKYEKMLEMQKEAFHERLATGEWPEWVKELNKEKK